MVPCMPLSLFDQRRFELFQPRRELLHRPPQDRNHLGAIQSLAFIRIVANVMPAEIEPSRSELFADLLRDKAPVRLGVVEDRRPFAPFKASRAHRLNESHAIIWHALNASI